MTTGAGDARAFALARRDVLKILDRDPRGADRWKRGRSTASSRASTSSTASAGSSSEENRRPDCDSPRASSTPGPAARPRPPGAVDHAPSTPNPRPTSRTAPARHKGLDYARSHNLTRYAYEKCVADLEGRQVRLRVLLRHGPRRARCSSSWTAAPHVVAWTTCMAARVGLFERVRRRSAGLPLFLLDPSENRKALEAALTPETKMIWVRDAVEPASQAWWTSRWSPRLGSKKARHPRGSRTTRSPARAIQRPARARLSTIVVHSATKYLNGHSDLRERHVAVTARRAGPWRESSVSCRNAIGSVPSAFDSFLVNAVDSRRWRFAWSATARNAPRRWPKWLEAHPRIEKVFYPGLRKPPSARGWRSAR